jgi:hypothetical protein
LLLDSCAERGCMDPNATNYDPDAESDDGSCVYDDQYAEVTIFRYQDCYDGAVELYLNGDYQHTFLSHNDDYPDCGMNGADAVTYSLLLGNYHFTAYSDSNETWDFYVNLSTDDACDVVALRCGGVVEGDVAEYPQGQGNLIVWSSFDFGNNVQVWVNGIYRGELRSFSPGGVPPCGESGSVSVAGLTPGVYTIDAENGTYTWSNYTVLVREGWCNSFELR